VKDSGADGWYVWSAHNKYDYLFTLLGQLAQEDNLDGQKTMHADAAMSSKPAGDAVGSEAEAEDTSPGTATKAPLSVSSNKNHPLMWTWENVTTLESLNL
jgi:hypothetical protein